MSNLNFLTSVSSLIKSFDLSLNKILSLSKLPMLAGLIYYLLKRISSKSTTKVLFKKSHLNNKISSRILDKPYKPTLYLPTFSLQAIYNEMKIVPHINYKREYLETHDGGWISLDWVVSSLHNQHKILVILHGMTGGSETSYIRDIVKAFDETGDFKIVVIQYRGINDTPLITPRSYHAGKSDDLDLAMSHIRTKFPDLRCYTIGTSMGANLFIKLFGSTNKYDDYVKGFVSISNPFNMFIIEQRLRGTILDFFLRSRQKKFLRNHLNILKYHSDFDEDIIDKISIYRDFDTHYTIKIFGFKTVDDFYFDCSCVHDLHKVNVRCLFINALDDCLTAVDDVKKTLFQEKENLMMVLTSKGSHVCWFEDFLRPKRWFVERALDYFEVLENHKD